MAGEQHTKAAKRRAQKRKKRERRTAQAKAAMRASPMTGPGPKPPREVSDVHGMSADEVAHFVAAQGGPVLDFLRHIRLEKHKGQRPLPSERLIGEIDFPPVEVRKSLLDQVARLVDENIYGRHNMCFEFAHLLALGLKHVGFNARAVSGKAKFRGANETWFEWHHAWVRYDEVLVDGNVDLMRENPKVPDGIDPDPYWGTVESIPSDRQYDLASENTPEMDEADILMWWEDLRAWLNANWVTT